MKAAVGARWLLTTARVRPESMRAIASAPAATTMSQPSSRSAPPTGSRTVWIASGFAAMRTWLITAPFFCARPVLSSTVTPLPSI